MPSPSPSWPSVVSCGSSGGTAAAHRPAFGVLSSTCDADRLAAERKAGLTAVAVTAEWSKFEPSPGAVDDAYAQALRARVDRCRNAGMTVLLGLGIQYPPQWVRGLDSGTFLNQNGDPSPASEPNIIFSGAVRAAAADYFRKLAAVVDLSSVSAIRIGTSDSGEQGFPESLGKNYFWAFDRAAQTGIGIASGMARTPLEGWTPGQPTWNGRPVGKAEVAAWYSWYAEASTSAVIWQMEQLDAAGFRGDYHLPTSGKGVSAKEVDKAAGALLAKPVDGDGALSRGLEYPVQFSTLAKTQQRYGRARVVIDVTSIDDSSAVAGRQSSDRLDRCTDSDPPAVDTDAARAWSNQRWTIAARGPRAFRCGVRTRVPPTSRRRVARPTRTGSSTSCRSRSPTQGCATSTACSSRSRTTSSSPAPGSPSTTTDRSSGETRHDAARHLAREPHGPRRAGGRRHRAGVAPRLRGPGDAGGRRRFGAHHEINRGWPPRDRRHGRSPPATPVAWTRVLDGVGTSTSASAGAPTG